MKHALDGIEDLKSLNFSSSSPSAAASPNDRRTHFSHMESEQSQIETAHIERDQPQPPTVDPAEIEGAQIESDLSHSPTAAPLDIDTAQIESEQPPTPTPIPIESETAPKPGTRSRTKTRNPKTQPNESTPESPSAAIIYVPVLVRSLPSDTSSAATAGGKSKKAAQPLLNEQQLKDWRCQADNCPVEAASVGRYYQRHRICPEHSKAPSVLFNGTQQRYCQQCSRFHELTEFDGSRRSCRRQLCRRRLLRTLNTFSNEEEEQI